MIHSARTLTAGLILATLMFSAANARTTTVDFTSTPAPNGSPATITLGLTYLYNAVASASDGSAVRYALRYGPAGMSVDAQSGQLSWSPIALGTFLVGIRAELASDPAVSATQEWAVEVMSPPSSSLTTTVQGGTTFCAGNDITVAYTADGTFAPGNAFILQLSNATGGFSAGFRNLGSISSTSSGTITARIPKDMPAGSTYRVRVMASNPVEIGSDNGTDLRINALPVPGMIGDTNFRSTGPGHVRGLVLQNVPVALHNTSSNSVSVVWDLGADATPATSTSNDSVVVTYATGGRKTVTLTATSIDGCSETATFNVEVTTTSPKLPATVKIAAGELSGGGEGSRHTWVCPGGVYHTGDGGSQFIYAEAGAGVVLDGGGSQTVYLKNGASITNIGGGGSHTLIYENGAGIDDVDRYRTRIPVSTMVFDYTDAPAGGCPSLAPYTKRIPDNSSRIVKKETSNASEQEYWVRGSGELTAAGDRNVYTVEEGGTVVATGDNCVVYLKNGATFDAQGGQGHRVFYEVGATIVNAGEGAAIFPSNDITLLYQGTEVSGVANEAIAKGIMMTPNPATTTVRITSSEGRLVRATLLNMMGQVIRDEAVAADGCELSVAGLPQGVYFVKLRTSTGTAVKELVVR